MAQNEASQEYCSESLDLLQNYQRYLDKLTFDTKANDSEISPLPLSLRVGVVGAGMAGLYSAMLVQKNFPGAQVKIFEASNRVGGIVHTHRFSSEPYDYFEAGAMRLPKIESHQPVF